MVIFHPLDRQHIRQIVDIQLKRVEKLLGKNRVTLSVSDAVKDWLAVCGFDPVYGSRPLKRVKQTQIVNPFIQRDDDSKKMEFEATE